MPRILGIEYKELLKQYLMYQNEADLYSAEKFSRQFIEKEIPPEEVMNIHMSALQEILPEVPPEIQHSFDFLIEMMIHYGLAIQEKQSLFRKQEEIKYEMQVASEVQETLLKTKVPTIKGLDIGLLSIPAKQMNGDYIYFVSDNDTHASVAVADVIGKGIPAALCMSIIKFGMDGLEDPNVSPRNVLNTVNRIVEKSVDDSMFISMFYGSYDSTNSVFSYASAGHEPALFYQAKENKFSELIAKGLLLGVKRDVNYEERSIVLEENDCIIMMTDGVTEIRTEEGFISMDIIKAIIENEKNSPAQVIVDSLYRELIKLQNFKLHDDFTIVIYKKQCEKV